MKRYSHRIPGVIGDRYGRLKFQLEKRKRRQATQSYRACHLSQSRPPFVPHGVELTVRNSTSRTVTASCANCAHPFGSRHHPARYIGPPSAPLERGSHRTPRRERDSMEVQVMRFSSVMLGILSIFWPAADGAKAQGPVTVAAYEKKPTWAETLVSIRAQTVSQSAFFRPQPAIFSRFCARPAHPRVALWSRLEQDFLLECDGMLQDMAACGYPCSTPVRRSLSAPLVRSSGRRGPGEQPLHVRSGRPILAPARVRPGPLQLPHVAGATVTFVRTDDE